MIISHKHKFIFVAIPKTATHAIRFALRPYLDDGDEEQVGLFEQKKLPYKALEKIKHGHITCEEIRPIVGEEIWNSYYKFAFVRNPFDRFISYCAFINRDNKAFQKNPQPFLYNTILNKKSKKHILFKPLHHFICDSENESLLNYVGKYENLQGDYDNICNQINIPTTTLEIINSSQRKPYGEYYDEELKALVFDHYKEDFELFSY